MYHSKDSQPPGSYQNEITEDRNGRVSWKRFQDKPINEPALEEACEVPSRCVRRLRRECEAKTRECVSLLYCDTI
jgi:hypothetical protein